MPLGWAIAIFLVLGGLVIAGICKARNLEFLRNQTGRNHCGIVTSNSSGGDIHFMDMSEDEITTRLRNDYYLFRDCEKPCVNAKDPSHLAEYRIFTNTGGHVKTIGYITRDRVVFEGKTYRFKET